MSDRERVNRVRTTFACSSCGEVFESERPDDDAHAEMKANWGDLPLKDRAVVCDDCYHQFMAWMAARQ